MPESERIRVLFCMPGLDGGGAERITLQLSRGLDPARFQARVLSFYRRGELLNADWGGIPIRHLLPAGPPSPRDWLQLTKSCAGDIWNSDVVVGTQEGAATALPLALATAFRKKFVAWVHIDWSAYGTQVSRMRKLSLQSYPLCDRVVTVSEGLRENVLKQTLVRPRKVTTVTNGVPLVDIEAASQEPLPEELAPAFQKPVIVACGRLELQKSFRHLVEAHKLVRNAGTDCNLVILGEGSQREQLQSQVRELGTQDSVWLPGFMKNPHAVVARAHVFAMSSFAEGHPLVLIEALACGTPVVATDCPSGPREILDNGAYGVLVPVGDVQALAAGLGSVLGDPRRRQELAALSRSRAKSLGLESCIRAWSGIFEEIAGGTRKQG